MAAEPRTKQETAEHAQAAYEHLRDFLGTLVCRRGSKRWKKQQTRYFPVPNRPGVYIDVRASSALNSMHVTISRCIRGTVCYAGWYMGTACKYQNHKTRINFNAKAAITHQHPPLYTIDVCLNELVSPTEPVWESVLMQKVISGIEDYGRALASRA